MKFQFHTGLAFTVALLAACSDNAKSGTSQQIDSAGGTVSEGEASVELPQGALDASTKIIVATSDVNVGAPNGYTLVGPAIAFTPHGTTFTKAVTLTLPYVSSVEQLAVLRLDDEQDQSWEVVEGGAFSGRRALLEVRSFSIYAVAAATAATYGAGGLGGGAGAPADGSTGGSPVGSGGSTASSSDGQHVSCDVTDAQSGLRICGDSFYPATIVKLLGANFPPPCQGTVVAACDTTGAVLGCHFTDVDGIPGVTLTNWFYTGTVASLKNGVLCNETNATFVDPP